MKFNRKAPTWFGSTEESEAQHTQFITYLLSIIEIATVEC